MATTEKVYIDRDNPFKKQLLEDGVAIGATEMAKITRAKVRYQANSSVDPTYFDSNVYPTLFDWVTEADDSIIIVKMGTMTGLLEGRDRKTELIIYDTTNQNGQVWDQFDLMVSAEAEE